MDEINSIEIYIGSIDKELFIKIFNNKIIVNGISKYIEDTKIMELFRIIRLWDASYYGDNSIDKEEFIIKVITSNNIDIIQGKGSYPKNYYKFKNWIGDICD